MSDESLSPQPNWTAERASQFGVEPQQPGESFDAFRSRVAGELRSQGAHIEAHEAYNNALYDDPDGGAMTGILGAVAQVMQNRDYGAKTGEQQVGDDIAAGHLVENPRTEQNMSVEMAVLMVEFFGRSR